MNPRCWMLDDSEVCFVHLGKYGDLMIMLPAFKAVADELGKPPICIVSTDFASIFDGVSYVRPWPMKLHWWRGVKAAREAALKAGFSPIVVKWWDEPGSKPPMQLGNGKTITLMIHGQPRKIFAAEWDSYQASQWRYAGFSMEQMMKLPLVFDRRNPDREQALRLRHFRSPKPKLLVNLSQSGTSPFKHSFRAFSLLHSARCDIVNLANIRAERIYDLLGLYDYAAGLVTTDTATLHLAAASSLPYIALLNNGGAGSVPKGNCILSLRYSEFEGGIGFFIEALQKIGKMDKAPPQAAAHA